MKQLIVISIVAVLAACGGKKSESTTPANKTGAGTGSGSTGGATYGGSAGSAMSQPTSGGDPCAN
ncbi:MAG: hypothetical protein ABI678_19520 [Kofleriaceae bacterium]